MHRWLRLPVTLLPLILAAGCGAPEPSALSAPGERSPSPATNRASAPTPTVASTASAMSSPEPTPLPEARGTYLALGDSLGVGIGASDPARTGYVGRIHRAVGNPVLENLSVSGETSHSFRSGGQLARALAVIGSAQPVVSLVTLDIGGNDLLRLLGSEPCASEPNSAACRRAVSLALFEFEASYRGALGDLRATLDASAPEATLAVMTYFNPFSGTEAAHEVGGRLALLGQDLALDCQAAAADVANRGMNDIIACVGSDLGALVADVHPRFEGLGLELTHIGAEDIHANDRGYSVIANAFLEALGDEGDSPA